MYDKEYSSAIHQKFWTSFGRYMQPVPNALGEKINWINYKTGVKAISIKIDVSNTTATICFEILNLNASINNKYLSLFNKHQTTFEAITHNQFCIYHNIINNQQKPVLAAIATLSNINIYNQADWPVIITFLKHNLIQLDNYWQSYKIAYELA